MLPATDSPTSRPSPAMVWLCAVLLLVAGLSQPLVLCTDDHGHTHLEFAHEEGDCCEHAHDHELVPLAQPTDDDVDLLSADPGCGHVDLAVDLAPSPQPDDQGVAQLTAATMSFEPLAVHLDAHGRLARHAPATGPPRPSRLLAARRTIVLQL